MNYWLEVTSGLRWSKLLKEGVRLDAPNTTRYQNFFKGLETGDIVLHYLTATLTPQKEERSSVVGVSKIASTPTVIGKRIVAKCSHTLKFPTPISYSELRGIKRKSAELRGLLKINMQKYLAQISDFDFKSILDIYQANKKRFSKSPLAKLTWVELRTRVSRGRQKLPSNRETCRLAGGTC
jgi:hypothetical protein